MGPINRFLSKTFHLGPHDLANLSFLYFATFVMRAAAFAGVARASAGGQAAAWSAQALAARRLGLNSGHLRRWDGAPRQRLYG